MAAKKPDLTPFPAALRDLNSWFDEFNAPWVAIGGFAAALLGRPRITRDLDVLVLIDDDSWAPFVDAGKRHGFAPRISDAVSFAAKSRVLLMIHTATKLELDVSLGALGFEEEMIAAAMVKDVSGVRVNLPRVEDLFLMKALARRDRDIADLEGIVARAKKLDAEYIRQRARELAELMEQPDLPEFVERFLKSTKRK